MRVLVLFSGRLLDSRGTPSRARNLSLALAALPDTEVLVLSRDESGLVRQSLSGLSHISLAGEPVPEALDHAVRRFDADVVHGHTNKALAPLARLAGACSGPRVVDLHGDLAGEKLEQSWRPFGRRLLTYARHRSEDLLYLRGMDGFTVVSHDLAARLKHLAKPTLVLWGGVDPTLFVHSEPVPHQSLRLAYAGNFRPYQGVPILLEALEILLAEDRGYHLTLIGDPAGSGDLLERARQRLGDRLAVVGQVAYQEVPKMLAEADVLVVPRGDSRSARYGFPSKLPEYLALGKAVVATDLGEQGRLIRDQENGLLARPGSARHLADRIRLLRDPALRRRLGQEARKDAEENLTWDRMAARLRFFLCETVGSTGRGKSTAAPIRGA